MTDEHAVAVRDMLLHPPPGNADRTAKQLAVYRALAVETEKEWTQIDLLISGLAPDVLEDARLGALAAMPEFLRERNKTADPRAGSHRLLRGMMVQWLKEGRKLASGTVRQPL